VKYVSIPNRSTRSAERKKLEKQRWFKRRQKGGPDAKDESAFSSAGMGWRAAGIGAWMG